jgi:hypothetical protein
LSPIPSHLLTYDVVSHIHFLFLINPIQTVMMSDQS